MACTFPFNQIKKGSTIIAAPDDFVYGTGTINLKGDDSALTTADGRIHNYRNALVPDASCEVRGDKRDIETSAPAQDGTSWPALGESMTFEYLETRNGTATVIETFSGIISAEYDSKENKTSLSIQGCNASY